jgi:hypothetical protein
MFREEDFIRAMLYMRAPGTFPSARFLQYACAGAEKLSGHKTGVDEFRVRAIDGYLILMEWGLKRDWEYIADL